MLQYLNKKRAQSTLEYAVLVIVIIGALLSIQVYLKRGVQGRLKQATDDIGDQFSVGNTNAVVTTNSYSKTLDTFGIEEDGTAKQGVSKSKLVDAEQTNTISNSLIVNADQEYWGK